MNLSTDKRSPVGGQQQQNAGAVAFGGPQQAAPANFQVGAVGFGPSWQDEEPGLRALYEEAQAQIAVYEQERFILEKEMRRLREQVAELRAGRLEQTL
jgi:hypothetical protein